MRNNKGISMITLIITIVVMLILISIGGYYSFETIDKANQKDAKEEMRNVEEVIGAAKAQGLAGKFTPNKDLLITDAELTSMFGGLLTTEQIEAIKAVNNDASADPLKKYYLLDQAGFDMEFGDSDNITINGVKRTYLVSYKDRVIMLAENGTLVSSGEIGGGPSTDESIKIVFSPNGNKTWATSQTATINVSGAGIKEMKYLWSQSSEEPTLSLINNTFESGDEVTLTGKTGNNWYIWVLINYEEDGIEKQYIERSNQFYIDNTLPTGALDVSGITK